MNKLINCLINKNPCLPIWFMRQAGRYLPEFQKVRSQNQNFIKLCLNSELSSKITLQPMSRFDLDAAIIFSDILMVPHSLGQKVRFEKNIGPILEKIDIDKVLNKNPKDFEKELAPIYDAIKKTRNKLDKNKSLISFVGSPWTLIVYMLGLKNEKSVLNLDLYNKKKKEIKLLLDKLTFFLKIHIKNQVDSGANVVQIFDSWAGLLPLEELNNNVYIPNKKLVELCKEIKIPVICFPKGIKENYLNFSKIVKPDCLSIDYDIKPEWARDNLKDICIQGGLDPKILLLDEKKIFDQAKIYLKTFKNFPYIFNLGHGLLPKTNPDRVQSLIKFVRNYDK